MSLRAVLSVPRPEQHQVKPFKPPISPMADTIPDWAVDDDEGSAFNEFEDTQPSAQMPYVLQDEDFADAPTLPGVRLRPDDPPGADLSVNELRAAREWHDRQWDRVLSAVADAVRRVFSNHPA